jgi:heme exporter protein A
MRLVGEAVSVFRGDRLVLDGIDFAVPAGGALLLLGPNGVGKSTLLRAIAGLKRLDGGRITLDGDGDLDAVKPGLTAPENLAFEARLAGRGAAPALAAVGLAALAEMPVRMFSAGQRRRLALSRLALSNAPVWLLDEPTLGLDMVSVARFGDLLAAHRAAGGMVLAATHLPLPMPGAAELALA